MAKDRRTGLHSYDHILALEQLLKAHADKHGGFRGGLDMFRPAKKPAPGKDALADCSSRPGALVCPGEGHRGGWGDGGGPGL